jgi:hypothetical protein
MIDTDTAEQILKGDDTHPDILQSLGLELLAEGKRLREENRGLRMIDKEYERVWEWLMENADHTCRKLLLLIEEWKEEDE